MLDLEAIERIKQLKARYLRFLDTANLDGLQSVFCDDATVNFKSPSYEIGFKGWSDLKAFFAQAFSDRKYGMHTVHHPEISIEGDTATGHWYLHDLFINEDEKTVLQGSALYADRYIRNGDNWLIQHSGYERLLEVVSPLPEDWQVICRPIQKNSTNPG